MATLVLQAAGAAGTQNGLTLSNLQLTDAKGSAIAGVVAVPGAVSIVQPLTAVLALGRQVDPTDGASELVVRLGSIVDASNAVLATAKMAVYAASLMYDPSCGMILGF